MSRSIVDLVLRVASVGCGVVLIATAMTHPTTDPSTGALDVLVAATPTATEFASTTPAAATATPTPIAKRTAPPRKKHRTPRPHPTATPAQGPTSEDTSQAAPPVYEPPPRENISESSPVRPIPRPSSSAKPRHRHHTPRPTSQYTSPPLPYPNGLHPSIEPSDASGPPAGATTLVPEPLATEPPQDSRFPGVVVPSSSPLPTETYSDK